ncbi:hypothetical protein CDD80_7371 [Ophiocordyceps camponoti-rufipedis]|uniref:Uncharacterized protein n=1 Tax=Ophiocordyceps camponoti-rufipedis TaxID=2004952 RepID=A0A2C5YIS0_9HYPO|nr:hypothetical protein CDD80_7371 [Ophiocordyceps camponoti-rufipedis]
MVTTDSDASAEMEVERQCAEPSQGWLRIDFYFQSVYEYEYDNSSTSDSRYPSITLSTQKNDSHNLSHHLPVFDNITRPSALRLPRGISSSHKTKEKGRAKEKHSRQLTNEITETGSAPPLLPLAPPLQSLRC